MTTCEGESLGWIGLPMAAAGLGGAVIEAVEGAWPAVLLWAALGLYLLDLSLRFGHRVSLIEDSLVFRTPRGDFVVAGKDVKSIRSTVFRQTTWRFAGRRAIRFSARSAVCVRALAAELVRVNPDADVRLGSGET